MKKICGNCQHFHKVSVPKDKKDIYKNGRCGLGYHNADETPTCRVYKEKGTCVMPPVNQPKPLPSFANGRFTSNPWAQWVRKDEKSALKRMMNGGDVENVEMKDPRNKIIYDVIVSMSYPIDYLTVLHELSTRGLIDEVGVEYFKSITE